MTSYDKVIKLACKPKAAAPKAKYLDPIIAATWSEDGAVHDVCKALSPRFREPNAIVVFKALIVLHTMIRNGATDNVLSYLSSSDVLRLQNVSAGNWEGYSTPQNLQHYAVYLDSRIRAYRDLKHDAIRVQAESNRDMRLSKDIEEDGAYRNSKKSSSSTNNTAHQRSKTIMGRKLRVMTVEKGLLRETKAVQRMIDSLVECRFYLDDLEDELTTTALRMLVKDLLILFQAGNEGVINVLEHYFEMSHIDAKTALGIYRHFCKQTERVVEYLGVAKKLQNLLNVPIPNLKHAPVSLAGALQEYLDDPNFEQNRIEYKTTKESADKSLSAKSDTKVKFKDDPSTAPKSEPAATVPATSTTAQPVASTSTAPKPDTNQSMQDFFSAIEEEQPTMFDPQSGSPTANYFQQQAATNPFSQQARMSSAFGAQAFGMQLQQPQQSGFVIPQQTASPFQQQRAPNPFGLPPTQQQLPQINTSTTQPQTASLFQQPQPTGFLQPQATGSNPFRQSMFPMSTGMGAFPGMPSGGQAGLGSPSTQARPVSTGQQLFASQTGTNPGALGGFPPFSAFPTFASPIPSTQSQPSAFSNLPPRPASTPLKSTSDQPIQFVKSHQTGTKNPFGVPMERPPPVPKLPTLMELSMKGSGAGVGQGNNANLDMAQGSSNSQQPSTGSLNGSGTFGPGSDMACVASSFAFNARNQGAGSASSPTGTTPSFLNSQNTSTTATGSTFSDTLFSSLSNQSTAGSGAPITVSPTLRPQSTGFGGIKPFKPSSSFGASLMGSLPPIPQSDPSTPAISGIGTSSGPTLSFLNQPPAGLPGLNSQPTSFGGQSNLSAGLRPQITGGAANPFRASMAVTGSNLSGMGSYAGSFGSPGGGLPAGQQPNGANLFAQAGPGAFGSAFAQDALKQQQPQQNSASLI